MSKITTLSRSSLLVAVSALLATQAALAASANESAGQPDYITVTDPASPGYGALHLPAFGGEYSGVARLLINNADGATSCSGALLSSGRHIMTAVHCVADGSGVKNLIDGVAYFPTTPTDANGQGNVLTDKSVSFSKVTLIPGYTSNNNIRTGDIAIIELSAEAPVEAKRYQLYTGTDEIGKVVTKVGWGRAGVGSEGEVLDRGTLRLAQNVWEMTAYDFYKKLNGVETGATSMLVYDFDNGLAANDAFGYHFGMHDLGLGEMEGLAGSGDSGGPSFIDGKVAGVVSYGRAVVSSACEEDGPDFLCGRNKSFGEFEADTRVSSFVPQIEAIMAVPEPASLAMMLAGLGVVGFMGTRRRRH